MLQPVLPMFTFITYSGKVPEDWGVTRYDQTVQIVSLSKDSDEYTRVEEKFTKTWPRVEIVDIQRIQNRNLYMQYALKKHTMEVPNEEKLLKGMPHIRSMLKGLIEVLQDKMVSFI